MNLSEALDAWRMVVGSEHVLTSESERTQAETTTFATSHRIQAIVRPSSSDEVARCLAVAHRHAIPVYPVSAGQNWGYGSKVPTSDGAVLLELHRLNRILEVNEALGYVTVEPGVTFGQLHRHLKERGSDLMVTVGGNPAEASLLGNALERGLGCGPYADRFATVCDLEVILPTGERIRSGHGRFEGARAAPVHRFGVGPSWIGLFGQSNFGVVTRATMWLLRLPDRGAHLDLFSAKVASNEALEPLVDLLRGLLLDGVRLGFGFWNDVKTVSNLTQYPWALTQETPLPDALLRSMKQIWRLKDWQLWGGLYSPSKDVAKATRKLVQRTLKPHAESFRFQRQHRDSAEAQTIWHGVPASSKEWNQVYWRKKTPRPSEDRDPGRDRCGVLWCAPCVPMLGSDVRWVVETAKRVATSFGFEPNICVIHATDRVVDVVPAILYDREVPGEDERAMQAHDAMLSAFNEGGYVPYRLGVQSMDKLPRPIDDSRALWARIKAAFDPRHILAPGRYPP